MIEESKLIEDISYTFSIEAIITGNNLYAPMLGYNKNKKPYPLIRITEEAWYFEENVRSRLKELPIEVQNKVFCIETFYTYNIPTAFMITKSGTIRRSYDLTNITKTVEDGIFKRENVGRENERIGIGRLLDDSMVVDKHERKRPTESGSPSIHVRLKLYKK